MDDDHPIGRCLSGATLTDADFSGADVRGARFDSTNLTPSQLYSTASYLARDLTEIGGWDLDMSGWNLVDQRLVAARVSRTNLTGADLSGADARGADYDVETLALATTRNFIDRRGHIKGLDVQASETMWIRDLDPTLGAVSLFSSPIGDIPIVIEDGMSIDEDGTPPDCTGG